MPSSQHRQPNAASSSSSSLWFNPRAVHVPSAMVFATGAEPERRVRTAKWCALSTRSMKAYFQHRSQARRVRVKAANSLSERESGNRVGQEESHMQMGHVPLYKAPCPPYAQTLYTATTSPRATAYHPPPPQLQLKARDPKPVTLPDKPSLTTTGPTVCAMAMTAPTTGDGMLVCAAREGRKGGCHPVKETTDVHMTVT